jgi:hypothetical protein
MKYHFTISFVCEASDFTKAQCYLYKMLSYLDFKQFFGKRKVKSIPPDNSPLKMISTKMGILRNHQITIDCSPPPSNKI